MIKSRNHSSSRGKSLAHMKRVLTRPLAAGTLALTTSPHGSVGKRHPQGHQHLASAEAGNANGHYDSM